MTLGPGTFGGSIISENVSAKHMFNVKRLAFETRPINPPDGIESKIPQSAPKPEIKPTVSHNPPTPAPKPIASKSWIEEIDERIRLKATNAPAKQPKEEAPSAVPSGQKLGSGISEDEVDKIIKEFSKR